MAGFGLWQNLWIGRLVDALKFSWRRKKYSC